MLLKYANKLLEASRIALKSEIPPDVSQQLKSLLKWLAEPCWNIFTQQGLAAGRCESSFSIWFMQFSVCTKNQHTHFENRKSPYVLCSKSMVFLKLLLPEILINKLINGNKLTMLSQNGLMVSSTMAVEKHDQDCFFSLTEDSCTPAAWENWLLLVSS